VAADRLSVIFSALADPTRRAMLARLSGGKANVTELAEPFSISLPAISRHRSSSLQAAPLREVADWMEPYRQFWDVNFDRLDAHLRRVTSERAAQPGAAQPGATQPEGTQS
jgi:DNA-binding transcriptional ArsR family regulator